MKDGLAASNLEEFPTYISGNINDHGDLNFYDIGMKLILEFLGGAVIFSNTGTFQKCRGISKHFQFCF